MGKLSKQAPAIVRRKDTASSPSVSFRKPDTPSIQLALHFGN
jgi:hypothetical protein